MAGVLDSGETAELKTAKNKLRDLKVPDVDIVNRAANRRRFLIIKKEDGMSEETAGSEFDTGDIAVDLAAEPESGTEPAPAAADTGAAPATPAAAPVTPAAAPATPAAADTGAAPATPATPAPATPEQTPEAIAKAEREKIMKAAEAHAALLAEKIAAIQKIADEIRTGAGTMDAKELKTKISQLERLGWKIDDPANVINILKAEGAEGAAAAVAKAIPTTVRDAVVKSLREASERLTSVNVVLRGATVTQDQVAAPLPDAVAREVRSVHTLIKSVLQKYPSPTAAAKAEGETETDPIPEPGYDTAHDLMKEAAAITLPAPVRDAVSKALCGASDLLFSIVSAVSKMETTEDQMPSQLPEETSAAVAKALGILAEVIEKYPAPAAKSDDVIAALSGHFKSIEKLVSGLAGGTVVVKEDPAPVEDPRITDLVKAVGENTNLIKKMAGEPTSSNALEDQGRAPVAKGGAGETEWPSDMANEG